MQKNNGNIACRVYNLLLLQERREAAWAVVAVFFNVLLDFASIAALLPVLYFLLDSGESRRAALLFCIIAMAVILVKCIVSTLLSRFQNKFLLALYKRLSVSLFMAYYNKGLLFIRSKGSNKLSYEINSICYHFSQGLLAPFIRGLGDALLLSVALVALLVYSPVIAAVIIVSFTPFMVLYMLLIRKRVKLYGEQEQRAKREQWDTTVGAFGGYSDLEVNNALERFKSSFENNLDEISSNRLNMNVLSRLPLFLSELSAVIGLCLMVLFSSQDVKILIGIFAVAAFRLLPAMRSLLQVYTQIKNATFCVDIIEEGIGVWAGKELDGNVSVRGNTEETGVGCNTVGKNKQLFDKDIVFSNISYSYPQGETVFKNFNCIINKGEYVGFSGYSGIGKSTLFNLLLGFLYPDSGKILIDGRPLSALSSQRWLEKIGYVSQDIFIFNGTIAENIALAESHPNEEHIVNLLEQVKLSEWVNRLPEGINTHLGERGQRLSGGQKQRIAIARALYKNIDLLLLDEATSALDNATEKEINSTINSLREQYRDLTILSIAHRQSSLEFCNRVINMEEDC